MNASLSFRAALVFAVALIAPRAASAAESYDNCTGFITSVPAIITTQGTWCLKQDLATAIATGNAIEIKTNNVTIDCNNFKLGGLTAGTGTLATGIRADNRQNLTVRHCNIRGFIDGVFFFGSSSGGNLIEDNLFASNTNVGMIVYGDGSMVRRNRVVDTGGTTVTADSVGIAVFNAMDVLDNTVSGVTATAGSNGLAYGIITNINTGGRVAGNGVRGLLKDGTGTARGIYVNSSSRVDVRDNSVSGDGSTGSIGLLCNTANDSAKDNVISGFATAIDTCIDSGGNAVIP
jgi:parallel beta-helix repeat protein